MIKEMAYPSNMEATKKPIYLLVNFGGPRSLEEIPEFLTCLLSDRDVIRTRFPAFFHNWFFGRVAKKRAFTLAKDYELIGGKSPIYFDTETLAKLLETQLQTPVYTFHRYLPATHRESLRRIGQAKSLTVLPLFPQFCYATTGSVARFLAPYFPKELQWVPSYATHPCFIASYQKRISQFLWEHHLLESETLLFFSAHGVPQRFVDEGDPYEQECCATYEAIMKGFLKAASILAYQSKFGKGEWLKPYTDETCHNILLWNKGRKNVVMVPMSFTSDHIETLFEVEKLYLPILASKGLRAFRCPALNLEPYWIDALLEILQTQELVPTAMLIRKAVP